MATEKTTAEKSELVKIEVLAPFRDKNDISIRYTVGTELEIEADRAADAVGRELAKYVEPQA